MGFSTCGLLVAVVLALSGPDTCFCIPLILGSPPVFGEQQGDVVVHENVFVDVSGTNANLMLHCNVTGSPEPTVTWFREGTEISSEGVLLSNGILGLNITEGNGATREGVIYYCTASNKIGPNNATTATARGRDIRVSYAFFGGFEVQSETQPVDVQVRLARAFSLECKVNASNPPPRIVWRRDGSEVMPRVGSTTVGFIEFPQNSRFLYFSAVTTADLGVYTCAVTNVLITETRTSLERYNVMEPIPIGEFRLYEDIQQNIEQAVGEELIVYIVGEYGSTSNVEVLSVVCGIGSGANEIGFSAITSTRLTITTPSPSSLGGVSRIPIQCRSIVPNRADVRHFSNLTVFMRPTLNIRDGDNDEKRDIIAGGPAVNLTCSSDGIPSPTARWFYNGGSTSGSCNVIESGDYVLIPTPQVCNSGIYQCFVSNDFGSVERSIIVEVTESSPPVFESLVSTNPMATSDRLEGTLLVHPPFTSDLTITAVVESNPCPEMTQWQFNGTDITSGDARFATNNPCSNPPPYSFNLTIANLTRETSGRYTLLLNNGFSALAQLPGFFVTVPVDVAVQGVSLEVVNNSGISCFLAGSTVVMTCNIVGYPRPQLVFLKSSAVIVPAASERISNISFDQIQIEMVDNTDQGAYSCSSDGMANAPPSTMFSFCTFPEVENVTSTSNPVEGQLLEIVCTVSGTPTPTIQWFKDDEVVLSQGRDSLRISITGDGLSSIININSASLSNNGIYRCMASNEAGSVSKTLEIQVKSDDSGPLSSTAIVAIAAGGAGLILIIILLVLLLVCVYLCARRSNSSKTVEFAYNVDEPVGGNYKDGRGNVDDDDSVDGNKPIEGYDPDYGSVPMSRPNEPPPYKAAPGYGHGGPLDGDDLELVKYPPQDSDPHGGSYYRPQPDKYHRPTPDDFLSEDADFV